MTAALIVPSLALAYWPVASTSSFVSQGYRDGHRGIDIAAPAGTNVTPMKWGVVVFAGWRNNCGGYQVWVRHINGVYSAYYHLKAEYVSKGQAVYAQETAIGAVGATGCASGPHVHMEVWKGWPWAAGSRRVNPWTSVAGGTYLPARYR